MQEYTTIVMKEIRGSKCVFSKLIKGNKCFFDEFEKEITKNNNFKKEFAQLISKMEWHAEGKSLPKEKFRNIQVKQYPCIFWEFKTKHLRAYTVCKENGKVVVIGGTKNTQEKDIERFKHIAKEYINK